MVDKFLPDMDNLQIKKDAAANHAICSSCGLRKFIVCDVIRGDVSYRICKTCQKNSAVIKVRNCLKCLKDFLSFCDYRICSKCKGKKWRDAVGGRHSKMAEGGEV